MKTNIQKTVSAGHHGRLSERLHIKTFKSSDEAHGFLNKQYDNNWSIARPEHADKKAGVYAFAGGQWHNVKTLDSSILAHI